MVGQHKCGGTQVHVTDKASKHLCRVHPLKNESQQPYSQLAIRHRCATGLKDEKGVPPSRLAVQA